MRAAAWQSCPQLQIVKLPGAHQTCSFPRVFCLGKGDCAPVSLRYVHANGGVNTFNGMTKLGHYLFDACINLAATTILQAVLEPQSLTPVLHREIPTGCFCSTGLSDLKLPLDFHRLGAHAFDNCKLLSLVDISDTTILDIREFTFANCVLLQRVMLPYTLHTIHSKAFMNCAALQELAIPPSLHYIACKAFFDCTVLRGLTRMPGKRTTWRGTYAEETAFALCPRWRLPQWLHLVPDLGYASDLA